MNDFTLNKNDKNIGNDNKGNKYGVSFMLFRVFSEAEAVISPGDSQKRTHTHRGK